MLLLLSIIRIMNESMCARSNQDLCAAQAVRTHQSHWLAALSNHVRSIEYYYSKTLRSKSRVNIQIPNRYLIVTLQLTTKSL